jgi:hypothetical protein
MSSTLTRSFRSQLELAASALGVRYGEFVRARGVNDFLLDPGNGDSDPHGLASQALETLTVGDKGKMDFLVCVAAIGFLDENTGANNSTNIQCVKDLALLVGESANRAQYRLWAQGWYG